ncbi:transglutaminase family protein [Roseomonas sp. BN140053]|uniref:transglutaminase family protein n=1 Tax=Roseomonas sp. BN140053 TaxID=3391898 RepID=UPI0039ECB7DA
MPILSVRHVTTYRYRQAVRLGEHRILCRPRDSQDQRLLDFGLRITPEPSSLHWRQDVFGNQLAVAQFDLRSRELVFESTLRLDHRPPGPPDRWIEEQARLYPFSYDAEEMPDLARCMERHYRDPERAVDRWARRFLHEDRPTGTVGLLAAMAEHVRASFTYLRRDERGVQEPAETLRLGSGTCRDFAVLMMEAVRSLGLAARFVTGYLHSRRAASHQGGGATHAWMQVYLPGAGWVEYDPTNGITDGRDLLRVAVAREPRQAVPLSGSYTGFPADSLGMTVEVEVGAEADPPA